MSHLILSFLSRLSRTSSSVSLSRTSARPPPFSRLRLYALALVRNSCCLLPRPHDRIRASRASFFVVWVHPNFHPRAVSFVNLVRPKHQVLGETGLSVRRQHPPRGKPLPPPPPPDEVPSAHLFTSIGCGGRHLRATCASRGAGRRVCPGSAGGLWNGHLCAV